MRTTLTLDKDVAERARRIAADRGLAFKQVVNEALRAGLREMDEPKRLKPYRTRPYHMGLRPGISLDNIQELIAQVEGEDAR